MLRGSLARRTSDGTNAAAAFELIANTIRGSYLKEMLVTLAAVTASTYGLGRPAAKGVTPTAPVTVLSESNHDAIGATTAIAWGTGPTVPAQFMRRVSFPATVSSSILWTFPEGIFIPAGQSLVLWNLAANGVVDVSVVVDESWV
jgi:hypothetical protein